MISIETIIGAVAATVVAVMGFYATAIILTSVTLLSLTLDNDIL